MNHSDGADLWSDELAILLSSLPLVPQEERFIQWLETSIGQVEAGRREMKNCFLSPKRFGKHVSEFYRLSVADPESVLAFLPEETRDRWSYIKQELDRHLGIKDSLLIPALEGALFNRDRSHFSSALSVIPNQTIDENLGSAIQQLSINKAIFFRAARSDVDFRRDNFLTLMNGPWSTLAELLERFKSLTSNGMLADLELAYNRALQTDNFSDLQTAVLLCQNLEKLKASGTSAQETRKQRPTVPMDPLSRGVCPHHNYLLPDCPGCSPLHD